MVSDSAKKYLWLMVGNRMVISPLTNAVGGNGLGKDNSVRLDSGSLYVTRSIYDYR